MWAVSVQPREVWPCAGTRSPPSDGEPAPAAHYECPKSLTLGQGCARLFRGSARTRGQRPGLGQARASFPPHVGGSTAPSEGQTASQRDGVPAPESWVTCQWEGAIGSVFGVRKPITRVQRPLTGTKQEVKLLSEPSVSVSKIRAHFTRHQEALLTVFGGHRAAQCLGVGTREGLLLPTSE